MEKFKVYELDFGDTNFLDENINTITEWIATDMSDMGQHDTLEYTITIRMMTREEIDAIPEWA